MIGILTNISDIKSHQNDNGSTLSLCAAFIHHKPDQCEITIFGKYLETREENILYVINHAYLGKYKYSRILESVMSQQLIDLMKILVLKQLMKNRFKAALNTRDNIISHLALQDCNLVEVGNNV